MAKAPSAKVSAAASSKGEVRTVAGSEKAGPDVVPASESDAESAGEDELPGSEGPEGFDPFAGGWVAEGAEPGLVVPEESPHPAKGPKHAAARQIAVAQAMVLITARMLSSHPFDRPSRPAPKA